MKKLKPNTGQVTQFLEAQERALVNKSTNEGTKGRLIFAMDATASREPTWNMACKIQGDMFSQPGCTENLSVQLVYYRGYSECRASQWVNNAPSLLKLMTSIRCEAGLTQIERVLKHTIAESRSIPVQALILVTDCMEENITTLLELAGQLRLIDTPLFIFQEGYDPTASTALKKLTQLAGGAHCQFDNQSASQLSELLKAVSAFTVGGKTAMKAQLELGNTKALSLLKQLN